MYVSTSNPEINANPTPSVETGPCPMGSEQWQGTETSGVNEVNANNVQPSSSAEDSNVRSFNDPLSPAGMNDTNKDAVVNGAVSESNTELVVESIDVEMEEPNH